MNTRRNRKWLLVSSLLVVIAPFSLWALGPDDEKSKSEFSVNDLKWMTGTWHGEIFGGAIVERWFAPSGGAMLGTSQMGTDRTRTTYELLLIEEKDGAPTMFLRHFKQYLTTQETTAMEFRLTQLDGKKAVFETSDASHTFTRITYELEDKTLVVLLEGQKGEKPLKIESRMNRKPSKKR